MSNERPRENSGAGNEDGFGHDGTRRVSRAQEQNVIVLPCPSSDSSSAARGESETPLFNSQFTRFVIPSEARDLHLAANCRSLASLGMTIHGRCRLVHCSPTFTTGSQRDQTSVAARRTTSCLLCSTGFHRAHKSAHELFIDLRRNGIHVNACGGEKLTGVVDAINSRGFNFDLLKTSGG